MTKQTIDLHTHSYCSDGTFSPEGLVMLAKQNNISAIALTDHDTLAGIDEFMKAGETHGVETIAGIELATTFEKYHHPEIHIVGLRVDCNILGKKLEKFLEIRSTRNEKMLAKLAELGMEISMEELQECAGSEVITRAHFAKAMLKKGYIQTRNEAFDKYISLGKPAYVNRELPCAKDCLQSIKEAGGIAILAHPTLYRLEYDQLDELCDEFKTYGLDGIECQYSTYTPKQRKKMLRLAQKHGLFPSGGSDFHGGNKPDIQLGRGYGHLEVPYAFWEEMKK